MKAFAKPKLDYDTWWDGLAPYLSASAQQAYSMTDPANVPASKVTGPSALAPSESDYLANVEVPTNVGTYTVLLSRLDGGSRWLVERLTPPEGLH
ncbi:hypothetical protein GCM10011584_34050 [Nocardioides phosphati]|uniref:Uncharacterized protein n=1 Tax=Nocardioides phosphati TaxID=1867775 RepID=A0ABQ2NFE5_9ACTN|nr:hypothetical protein [Nocardioides phosphati]GGO94016.1 hypothetical protein GCM10011584_34050 [Nocardioides phosphati]